MVDIDRYLMTLLAGISVLLSASLVSVAAETAPTTHPEPERTKGWSTQLPPDVLWPSSGRRSNVFYAGEPVTFKLGAIAKTYEVRDYFGELVDQGAAGANVTLNVKQPGWYKLYVYGGQARKQWGDIAGTTTFVVFRNDTNFPALPSTNVFSGSYASDDEPMRGVLGIGPQRHSIKHPENIDEEIRKVQPAIAVDKQYYLPYDPVRQRVLMLAWPPGTKDHLDAVRKALSVFKSDIKYWEPRNEPNFGSGGADFARNEMKGFYETVKSVDPSLKVMGPGTVSLGPQLHQFLNDFFQAGGGKYIDVFSFHIYNGINGDLFLGRKTMDTLDAMLHRYGKGDIEKWQTEQGYYAAVYGSYQPRMQGRWTMLEMMLFDQYGIPREHNHLWYDKSHGFWDIPTWWENDDGSLNPAAPLMRVFAEELYGTTFSKAFDFGRDGNKLYLGNLYAGENKATAAFMNAGAGISEIELKVKGGDKLHVTSAFGVESEIPVRNGTAKLPVPEIPVYVDLARGQTVEPVPMNWGANLARQPGVKVSSSGRKSRDNISKLNNGKYESWYWMQNDEDMEWIDDTEGFPAWVEFDMPAPKELSRVAVFCGVPWQMRGTLVDHELQYEKDGKWITIDRVTEPTKTFGVFSPVTHTTVDTFFADRWIFEHKFAPVVAQKVRLLVHQATYGQGATSIVPEAGGQTGANHICLREVEIYGPEPALSVRAKAAVAFIGDATGKVQVSVVVMNKMATSTDAVVRMTAPEGWKAAPAELPVKASAQELKSLSFDLVPPAARTAGPASAKVDIVDAKGGVLDSDTVTVTVQAPLDVALITPEKLDKPDAQFSADLFNATAKPVSGILKFQLKRRVAGQDKETSRDIPFGPVAAYEKTTVPLPLGGMDLTKCEWTMTCSATLNGVTATATKSVPIHEWNVAGPFPNDFDRDFGPEKGFDHAKTYPGLGGKPVAWRNALSAIDGYLDLLKFFENEPHENVCAYAVIYVKSPAARDAMLSAGSDDGVKIWFNGKQVVSHNADRGAVPGQEKAAVQVLAGWNEVIMKITQGTGGWGLYFDVLQADGNPLADLTYSPVKKD